MAPNENLLSELPALGRGEQDTRNSEQATANSDEADMRQLEPKMGKYGVLVGAGIIQLPIWGFAVSYGVFQEYYYNNWTLDGDQNATGVIGTTANGVMYIAMPFLFALFTRHWAHWRQAAALCGTVVACISFLLSSYSTRVWHLVVTQGITSAFGCAVIFSVATLSLGEWYSTSNRALAYGITLSCKNIVGTSCPFIMRALISAYGFRMTLRIWTAIMGGTSIVSILFIPTHPSKMSLHTARARKIPWDFLKHKAVYFYCIAIIFQSSGYGIPQTYLSTYARDITQLSEIYGTVMLAVFNASGIIASSFFGWLSDNKVFPLSVQVVSSIPPFASAMCTFLFWGLTTQGSVALLVLYSITFGFFSSGYSATWGGMLKDLERDSSERNEAIDSGMIYGILNGVRGIGYASGGFASIALLKSGTMHSAGNFGYGTMYGPLIIFTGLSSALGSWVILWRWKLKR